MWRVFGVDQQFMGQDMTFIELQSRLIDGFDYREEDRSLRVFLSNGQVREFDDISKGKVEGLKYAKSPGDYYMTVLRPLHQH